MRAALDRFVAAHPMVSGVAVILIQHVVLFTAAGLLPPLTPAEFPDLGPTLVNAVVAAAALGFVALAGWWRQTALPLRGPDRGWSAAVVPLPVVASLGAWGVRGTGTVLLSSAVLFLVLAVAEEVTSRGVLQHVLRALGMGRAAVVGGVMFGLGHLLSAVWFHRPPADALAQVVSASAFGVCFAALRWHLGTLWPLVLLHAAFDFLNTNSAGPVPSWWHLIVAICWAGYGWWLLTRLPAEDPAAKGDRGRGGPRVRQGPARRPASR